MLNIKMSRNVENTFLAATVIEAIVCAYIAFVAERHSLIGMTARSLLLVCFFSGLWVLLIGEAIERAKGGIRVYLHSRVWSLRLLMWLSKRQLLAAFVRQIDGLRKQNSRGVKALRQARMMTQQGQFA